MPEMPAPSAASIVGVVKDVRYASLRADAPLMIYRPYRQETSAPANTFLIRTSSANAEALTPFLHAEVRAVGARASAAVGCQPGRSGRRCACRRAHAGGTLERFRRAGGDTRRDRHLQHRRRGGCPTPTRDRHPNGAGRPARSSRADGGQRSLRHCRRRARHRGSRGNRHRTGHARRPCRRPVRTVAYWIHSSCPIRQWQFY